MHIATCFSLKRSLEGSFAPFLPLFDFRRLWPTLGEYVADMDEDLFDGLAKFLYAEDVIMDSGKSTSTKVTLCDSLLS